MLWQKKIFFVPFLGRDPVFGNNWCTQHRLWPNVRHIHTHTHSSQQNLNDFQWAEHECKILFIHEDSSITASIESFHKNTVTSTPDCADQHSQTLTHNSWSCTNTQTGLKQKWGRIPRLKLRILLSSKKQSVISCLFYLNALSSPPFLPWFGPFDIKNACTSILVALLGTTRDRNKGKWVKMEGEAHLNLTNF